MSCAPARATACMLHYGSKDDPHLILIDGGPSDVYKPHLKPRIVANPRGARARRRGPAARRRGDGQPCRRRSHQGHPRTDQGAARPEPDLRLNVASLWHNSFDDLLTTKPKELKAEAGFGTASLGGGGDGGRRGVRFRIGPGELREGCPGQRDRHRGRDRIPGRPGARQHPAGTASCATMRGRSAGSQITNSRASSSLRPMRRNPSRSTAA